MSSLFAVVKGNKVVNLDPTDADLLAFHCFLYLFGQYNKSDEWNSKVVKINQLYLSTSISNITPSSLPDTSQPSLYAMQLQFLFI